MGLLFYILQHKKEKVRRHETLTHTFTQRIEDETDHNNNNNDNNNNNNNNNNYNNNNNNNNNNNRHNTTLNLKKKKAWEILHLSWAVIPGMDRQKILNTH